MFKVIQHYIREKGKKTLPAFSAASGTMGTVADVMEPIAPFAQYLYFASLGALLLLLATALVKAPWRDPLAGIILFFTISAAINGTIYYCQSPEQPNGLLASQIEAVAKLQARLGIMQQSLTQIDQQTKAIATSNEQIAQHTQTTAQEIAKLNQNLEKLVQDKGQAAIISEPSSPRDYYQNARLYEMKGDYRQARQAYLGYFQYQQEYIDPHLRYQGFLKIQEGFAGAREIYNEQFQQQTSTTVAFAKAMLLESEPRQAQLEEIVAAQPDFTPAWYELSRLYSSALLGRQTSEHKLLEKQYLEQVIRLNEQGQWLKYYLDQEQFNRHLDDAQSRYKLAETRSETGLKQTLTFTPSLSNLGFQLELQYLDTPQQILYKTAEMSEFQSTGQGHWRDPETGLLVPNTSITLAKNIQSPQSIQFKLVDASGNVSQVYQYHFDAQQHAALAQQQMLEMTKNAWLLLRDFDGETLVYFSQIASSRCAISAVHYSINNDKLDQQIQLPPCDLQDPFSLPDDYNSYFAGPNDLESIKIQLTYHNQQKSSVETFRKVP
ncbi:tetratricopeptide repeat protein [Motilimonas sp. KMU-193]|uniref:tetratricopeptide repeat protein n=1 Tax=Motilimonas sp. KMU-193 TaxID=3388668 RepID=UPI00396B3592